jgi:hypothetical protein
MTSSLRNILAFSSATFSLAGCDAAKDAATAAIEGGAQTSYCEAVCDWAVGCSGEEDALDACLEATRAADATCAGAESGDLEPVDRTLVTECVTSMADDTCEGLTGSVDQQTLAVPSAACLASEGTAAADAYNAARAATQSSGTDFCDDLGTSICAHVVDCLVGDLGVDEATDVLLTACEDTAISALVSSCKGVDLEASYGTDPNLNRMGANTCATTLDGLADSCDVFSAAAWPAECGAVVVDASALPGMVSGLLSFAESYGVTP